MLRLYTENSIYNIYNYQCTSKYCITFASAAQLIILPHSLFLFRDTRPDSLSLWWRGLGEHKSYSVPWGGAKATNQDEVAVNYQSSKTILGQFAYDQPRHEFIRSASLVLGNQKWREVTEMEDRGVSFTLGLQKDVPLEVVEAMKRFLVCAWNVRERQHQTSTVPINQVLEARQIT